MRYSRAWYAVLLLARLLLAVCPAYIHPDEFFQAPEVVAGDVLGVDALRTWEFSLPAPVRSIVPIYLYAGAPMALLKAAQALLLRLAGWQLELTPWRLLCASRLFMVAVSLIIDVCVYRTLRRLNPGAQLRPTVLLLASSYCLGVLCCHTFANAFAAAVLAACFDLLSLIESRCARRAHGAQALALPCAALGAALALGVFSHITFAAFALPLGGAGAVLLARRAPRGLAAVAAGGALAALGLVLADSAYYGTLRLGLVGGLPTASGSLTLTVLNNVRYNSNRGNLATHGIHPWYTHLLVSGPTLFGPLGLLAAAKAWHFVRSPGSRQGVGYVSVAAACSVMSGLAVLSAIPHQEPRFLIPALPGIVLSTWRWHRLAPGRFWCLWVVFNAVLAIGYGVVHQAGVVPVLDFVSRTSALATAECRSAPAAPDAVCASANPVSDGAARGAHTARIRTTVLFVSTYMAPRHLLAQPANNDARQARIELHDLVGMDGDEIRSLVRNSTRVSCALLQKSRADELVARQTQPGLFERTLVVIPASADMARVAPAGTTDYALAPVYSYGPHVNFDHVAEVLQRPWQRSRLGVFALCDDDNPR